MLFNLQHQFSGQLKIQMHVNRQQRMFCGRIGFHHEWHRYRNRQIVLFII
ncbi:Uncharacterised protein [Klebsiella pneumoniae]|nr:Uncharacterised protein [Klebsiella pneumoniae]